MLQAARDFLYRCFYLVVHTNLLIAAAAMAQCALSYLIFEQPVSPAIVLLEGAATLLLYNFSLYLSKPNDPQASPYKRTRWVFSHLPYFYTLSVLALGCFLYYFMQIAWVSKLFLLGTGICSLLYSFPLIEWRGRWVGLRQIPALKIFHIAFVWVLSSVVLPFVDLQAQGISISYKLLYTLMLLKFIFLLICTLPFDIRDIKQDSYYHLRTLPSILGAKRAQSLCYMLLLTHSLAICFSPYTMPQMIGLLLTNSCIALVLRLFIFKAQAHYHYAYLLDAAMVLQFLFVWLIDCI